MRFAVFASLLMTSACLLGYSKEDHPRDVETTSAPKVTAGSCEGDEAPTLAPASFFSGLRPSDTRPAAGSIVAFEGIPLAQLICTQKGCQSECCDNSCGFQTECPYVLRDEGAPSTNEICLAHSSFECGGTDCSPFCEPFSHAPKQKYRFVGRVEYRNASLGQTPILRIERFCEAAP